MQEPQGLASFSNSGMKHRLKLAWDNARRSEEQRSIVLIGIFILIAIALNAQNLWNSGIPVHGDLTYPWNLDNYRDNYRFLFSDSGSISNLESVDRAAVLLPLSVLAQITGLGIEFVHRVLYLGIPLISMLTMLFLLRFVFERVNPAWIRTSILLPPCIIYALSPWVLEQVQAYLFWLAYALTPLLFVLAFRFFERNDLRSAAYLALVLTAIASTPQYLVFSWIAVGVIGLVQTAGKRRHGSLDRQEVVRTLTATGALAVMFTVLNFYWLFPTLQVLYSGRAVNPGFEADPSMTQLFSTNSSALNVLRGHDQWIRWYQADSRLGFIFNRFWIVNSLVIPVLSFAALLGKSVRNNKQIQVIALLGLAYGALALGTSTPIYDWLVFNVPFVRSFGWVLRVPGKLSYVLWVLYALMLGIMIAKLMDSSLGMGLKKAIVGAVLISAAVSLLPKTAIYFFDYYAPVEIPPAYEQLHAFLKRNDDRMARVLYLAPYDFAFGDNSLQFETSYTWNPDRLAAASPAISAPVPSISYYHLTYRDWQYSLYPLIYPRIPLNLGRQHLTQAGVRYLVYHNDIVGAEDRGQKDIKRLRRSDMELVASFGSISVFENQYYEGVLRTESITGELTPAHVDKVSPAEYTIDISSETQAHTIVMAQPFDPMWVMRADGTLVSPEPSDGVGMRFEIPSEASEVKIEYFPQPFYEAGLLVSGLGFVLIGILLIAIRKVGKKEPGRRGLPLR
jgi:hypothetical protein